MAAAPRRRAPSRTPTSRGESTRARRWRRPAGVTGPPSAPSPRKDGRLRRQASATRLFIPSAVTILAICAGLTAMRFAGQDQINAALALVVAAALLDAVDGRVARMMDATTKIGAEIDSLADAINFGVVPAVIIYTTLLDQQNIGWILTLIYVCAIVLRLARFNTLLDDDDAPGYTRDYFVGVPAPAAAIIALLPLGLVQQFGTGWWSDDLVVGIWLMLVALLAVSRVPTASVKSAAIPPRALAALLILVAIAAALLLTYPYILMIVLIGGYLLHIPFAWRNQRWVAARPEHWEARASERRVQRRAARRSDEPGGRRRTPLVRGATARLGLRRPQSPDS